MTFHGRETCSLTPLCGQLLIPQNVEPFTLKSTSRVSHHFGFRSLILLRPSPAALANLCRGALMTSAATYLKLVASLRQGSRASGPRAREPRPERAVKNHD